MTGTRILYLALALSLAGTAGPASAGQAPAYFQKVELSPIQHQAARLELVSPDGVQVTLSPDQLEAIGSYRLVTRTPWRTEAATFEGPLLSDVLALAGLSEVAAIEVVAENEYAVTIERDVWTQVPIMVATRVNGKAHSRRARGPIQFVMDLATFEKSPIAGERHWVWMAARIQQAK